MNVDDLQTKLISIAQGVTPSSEVPYGFERRVMAQIKGMAVPDYWAVWARALWRAAGPCVAVALVLAILSFFSGPSNTAASSDLSQDLENTLLAGANLDQPPIDAQR
jgi:hypothetical protein